MERIGQRYEPYGSYQRIERISQRIERISQRIERIKRIGKRKLVMLVEGTLTLHHFALGGIVLWILRIIIPQIVQELSEDDGDPSGITSSQSKITLDQQAVIKSLRIHPERIHRERINSGLYDGAGACPEGLARRVEPLPQRVKSANPSFFS